MGLASAMSKGEDAVRELVELAGRDLEILESVRQRTEREAAIVEERRSSAVGDQGPPEAPALLATRLLDEAIRLVDEKPESR